MCEFVPFPQSCARLGNPPQADAKRRGGFLGGTLSLPPKKGCRKNYGAHDAPYCPRCDYYCVPEKEDPLRLSPAEVLIGLISKKNQQQ